MKFIHPIVLAIVVVMAISLAGDSEALTCGSMTCEDAGPVNDSPFNVGEFGDFASSVDNVSDGQNLPPENAGDMFAHAWSFTLNENANVNGTITNNNSIAGFNIKDLTLQLFAIGDLTNNIGGTFVAPATGTNPLVAFAFLDLAPGDYFFKVSGELLTNDGQYTSQLAVSQVPLPPAIWLLLSAILGMVSITRFRRSA